MTPFQRAVRIYCEGLDTVAVWCPGKDCPNYDGPDHQCEPDEFSREQCDSCGSTLAGYREQGSGIFTDSEGKIQIIPMVLCTDCTMYHANGDEPDTWEV